MRIAVISCWGYRDAWTPFFALLDKFWPHHTVPLLITDFYQDVLSGPVITYAGGRDKTWCQLLAEFAASTNHPVLLFQEDFFLSAPVHEDLIDRGIEELRRYGAGCVRLYPCPGGDIDYGDPYFALVRDDAPYKVSCQAAIWNPDYLQRVAAHANGMAWHFEIKGTEYAYRQPEPVIAFKRDVRPWPMEYLCSGISAGRWNPDSKRLCDKYGIENDWSMRPFEGRGR